MKKIYTIIAGLLLTASVFAQAPEKMSYQAVVRDASNQLVTNTSIGIQISILQGSVTGTPVYVETENPTTNANGLVSLEIGTGIVVSGDFTTIDWANGTYFIKTETDPTGGTNYTITGTTQLMSVPYALHAKTAESITGTVNYTETDPVFGASIASGITAADTMNWNNHTGGTQIDSTGIAAFGYVAGPHTIDTDTQLDSTGVAGLGFAAGAHTDSTAIANMGFNAGGITTEVDGSVTNEIQVLSKSGSMVSLSLGGGSFIDAVDDADNSPTNELQTLSKTLDIVTLSNTGGSFSVNDADADPLNEIQDISLSGNNLSLTNGSTVDLSNVGFDGDFNSLTNVPANLDLDYTDDFDGQYSSLTGAPTNVSAFTNDAGYLTSFTEADPIFGASPAFGITNTLMNNWNTAYSWGDHSTQGYLTSFTEVDGSVTNEIQTLSISGNNLSISGTGGNTIALPTSTSPWTISGSDIYRNTGSVGIGTVTPLTKLDVNGDMRATKFVLGSTNISGNHLHTNFNTNGTDVDISYGTGWLTFMPTPSNVAFALDNNGNAIMGLGTNKVGIGTASPTEKLEVNGKIKSTNTRVTSINTNQISTTTTAWGTVIPDLTVNFTSGNNLPVMILVKIPGTYSNVVGARGGFRLLVDGVEKDYTLAQYVNGSDVKSITLMTMEVLSAGSHTATVEWETSSGTLTACWGTSKRRIIVWE